MESKDKSATQQSCSLCQVPQSPWMCPACGAPCCSGPLIAMGGAWGLSLYLFSSEGTQSWGCLSTPKARGCGCRGGTGSKSARPWASHAALHACNWRGSRNQQGDLPESWEWKQVAERGSEKENRAWWSLLPRHRSCRGSLCSIC